MSALRPKRGDVIAHYRALKLLGAGMEGNVYLVTDLRDGALRTLKILRGRDMVAEAKHTATYYRNLASIRSIKRFREWGVLTGQPAVGLRPWLAFDYIRGQTVADCAKAGRLASPRSVLAAVCTARHQAR